VVRQSSLGFLCDHCLAQVRQPGTPEDRWSWPSRRGFVFWQAQQIATNALLSLAEKVLGIYVLFILFVHL